MDPFWTSEILGLCAYLTVAAVGGVAAAGLFFLWPRGKSWLPLPRVRWGRWTGGDIVLVVVIYVLAPLLVFALLQKVNFFEWFYGQDQPGTVLSLWVAPLALPLFLLLAFLGLYYMSGTYPVDLGVSRSRWPANLLTGYVGFLLATPLVLGLNVLLSLMMHVKKHPFEELDLHGLVPIEWCLLFFSAMIWAPITEELLYRGLILGWLRRAPLSGHGVVLALMVMMSLGQSVEFNDSIKNLKGEDGQRRPAEFEELIENVENINWVRIAVTLGLGVFYFLWLRRLNKENLFLTEADYPPDIKDVDDAPTESREESTAGAAVDGPRAVPAPPDTWVGLAESSWAAQDLKQQRRKSWLAIFGSAVLFAMLHGTWPGPIALLLLGLVLGWLAQRTQNLLPAVFLHALFNAVAVLMLLFSALYLAVPE